MCTPIETDPRPAGFIRPVWAWLCGRPADPIPTGPEPVLMLEDAEAESRLLKQGARQSGRPMCERCGSVRSEDDATMHRRWCASCDLSWIEEQICWPLVARLGRRGARKALRALVKGEIRVS